MIQGSLNINFSKSPESFTELAKQTQLKDPSAQQVIDIFDRHVAMGILFRQEETLYVLEHVQLSVDEIACLLALTTQGILSAMESEKRVHEHVLPLIAAYRGLRQHLLKRFDIAVNRRILGETC